MKIIINIDMFFLDGISFDYTMDYLLEKKDGKDYVKPIKSDLVFDVDRGFYHFDNLFEGNKQLGKKKKRYSTSYNTKMYKFLSLHYDIIKNCTVELKFKKKSIRLDILALSIKLLINVFLTIMVI